jgi:hypothetical protein
MENTDEVVQSAVDKLVGLKTYWVYASEEVQYAVKIQAIALVGLAWLWLFVYLVFSL